MTLGPLGFQIGRLMREDQRAIQGVNTDPVVDATGVGNRVGQGAAIGLDTQAGTKGDVETPTDLRDDRVDLVNSPSTRQVAAQMRGQGERGSDLYSDSEGKLAPNLRALALLEAVANAGVPVTPTEIQHVMDLPKPTVHRLFQLLESQGYLQRDIDGKSYAPSQRSRDLAVNVVSSMRVRAARLSILKKLSGQIGETCNIAIPERNNMIYLDRYETSWPLRIQLPVGTKVPLYATASGKLFLSSLRAEQRRVMIRSMDLQRHAKNTVLSNELLEVEIELTKNQGFAVDNEEFVDGMVAIAVPVYGKNRRLFCTLSFHAPVQRVSLADANRHVPTLKRAAEELKSLI